MGLVFMEQLRILYSIERRVCNTANSKASQFSDPRYTYINNFLKPYTIPIAF